MTKNDKAGFILPYHFCLFLPECFASIHREWLGRVFNSLDSHLNGLNI